MIHVQPVGWSNSSGREAMGPEGLSPQRVYVEPSCSGIPAYINTRHPVEFKELKDVYNPVGIIIICKVHIAE